MDQYKMCAWNVGLVMAAIVFVVISVSAGLVLDHRYAEEYGYSETQTQTTTTTYGCNQKHDIDKK